MQSHLSDVAGSRQNLRFGDTLSQSTLSDTEAIAEADEAIEWHDDGQGEEQQQQEQNSDDERSNPSPSHTSSPSRAGSPRSAGSQMQPGGTQTRAFYFCTGCHNTIAKKRPPTFRCLKSDPNIRDTLINSNLFDRSVLTDEIALKWFVAHDLVWVPKPKEVSRTAQKARSLGVSCAPNRSRSPRESSRVGLTGPILATGRAVAV